MSPLMVLAASALRVWHNVILGHPRYTSDLGPAAYVVNCSCGTSWIEVE